MAASEEGPVPSDACSPQQTPSKIEKRRGEAEGLNRSNDLMCKRKVVGREEESEDNEQYGGQGKGRTVNKAAGSGFIALPDGLHRDIAALLRSSDIGQVASTCRSLRPPYSTCIRSIELCLFAYKEPLQREAMQLVFPSLLGRLTALETIRTSTMGLHVLNGHVTAAATWLARPTLMLTVREVQVGMPGYESSPGGSNDGLLAPLSTCAREGLLCTFIGWLGRSMWPRLQQLKFISPVTSVQGRLRDLAAAMAARDGGVCDRLQALEIDWCETDRLAAVYDEGAMRQLLSSECCRGLRTFRVGAGIMLSAACFKNVVEFVTSPHGQQLEVLHCRSNPSRVQQDPHLITALAEGCLPNLRKLEVSYLMPEVDVSPEASAALYDFAAGPFSKKLEVFKCRAWPGLFEPLMEGVRAGHGFLELRSLTLLFTRYAAGLMDELCRAMEAGNMPRLESMNVQSFDGAGLLRLMESLSGGQSSCSATLTTLFICHYYGSDEEGEASWRAVAAGACPRLSHLTLTGSRGVGDRTVKAIADAVRVGAIDRLRYIDLAYTSMGDEGLTALKSAMVERRTSVLVDVTFAGCKVSGGRTKLVAASYKTPKEVYEL